MRNLLNKELLTLWFLKALFLDRLYLAHINDFPDDVIVNIAVFASNTTMLSIRVLICGSRLPLSEA